MPYRTNDIKPVSISQSLATEIALSKYIKSISMMSSASAREYRFRLQGFGKFITLEYNITLDDLLKAIKDGLLDPYDVLSRYIVHLQTSNNISALSLKQRVTTAKNFLEYFDVEISPRKFMLKVKLPRVVRKDIQALTKEDITNILNACSHIRLKTYVMLLASTGMRASEALSIRLADCDLSIIHQSYL